MKLNLASGWLKEVDQIESSNFNARPVDAEINMIVVHCISLPEGQYDTPYIRELFTNQLDVNADPSFQSLQEVRVSAHVLINRQGLFTQFVSFSDRAWHAGASEFKGQEDCNDFSIGIELEGTDKEAYTSEQYKSLSSLVILLTQSYPKITRARIVGHDEIAPGRKTDPGQYFDWGFLSAI